MKLKPLHIILICIIIIECVLIGLHFTSKENPISQSVVTLTPSYSMDNEKSHPLSSLLSDAECPTFKFGNNENTLLEFNGSPVDFLTQYHEKPAFHETYPKATDEDWTAYRDAATGFAIQEQDTYNHTLEYARSVAGWYNVNPELLRNNTGLYTITFTTSITEWNKAFEKCLSQSAAKTELALGAAVRIDETDYEAAVYMVVDGSVVRYHVMFGTKFLSDFNAKDVKISIFTPDGTSVIAQTVIRTSHLADMMESRYRSILNTAR